MDIEQIDFGKDTAEFDKHLSEYFLQTSAYNRVISGDKSIVIGRKGTGKTSILKYCIDNEKGSNNYIVKIEASHSTYVKIDENLMSFTSQVKNLDSSFKLGWLFTTLLAVLDKMVKDKVLFINKEEAKLYEFAKEKLGYDENDPISAIAGYVFSWIKNLKSVGPIEREIEQDTTFNFFDELKIMNLIKSAIKRVSEKGKTLFLFYDKLDERWDCSDLHISFLQGLFLAIKDIKASGLNVVPIVLLRDDIFDISTANFQHIDHYRMEIEPLKWDELSILELISLRIKKSIEKTGQKINNVSNESLWDIVFPDQIPARKQPVPAYTYMIERTLFRPRDIILFANTAKDEALNQRHNAILWDDISKAEEKFSKYKLGDLIAEVSFYYPNIHYVLNSFKKKSIGYTIEQLRDIIIEIYSMMNNPPDWLSNEDDTIKILYSIGFLSYTTQGGILRGTRIIHSAIEPDSNVILDQKRVYVSPIFRKALQLRDH